MTLAQDKIGLLRAIYWPEPVGYDRVALAKLRLVVVFSVVVFFTSFLAVIGAAAVFAELPTWVVIWALCIPAVALAVPPYVHATGHVARAGAIVIGGLAVNQATMIFFDLDKYWDSSISLLVIPVLGVLAHGVRVGWFWALAVAMVFVLMGVRGYPKDTVFLMVMINLGLTSVISVYVSEVEKTTADLDRLRHIADRENRAKSDFLANVSHEIRTPMHGVMGVLQLLSSEDLSDDACELVETACAASERLMHILNDILDYSKIVNDGIVLERVPFAPPEIVDGAVASTASQARENKVRIDLRIDPALPDYLTGDPARLAQVVVNFVSNAVKYTQNGTVRITVAPDDGGDFVRVEVSDTGIGMTEEARGRIFERFEQAEVGTTRRFGGTGLGLAIARELVAKSGGDIGVDSTPGKGSTFWFTFPLVPAEASASGRTPDAPVDQNRWSGVSVLLADDNRANRMIASRLLGKVGIRPMTAENGQEALDLAQVHGFDLILMDIKMPVVDGLEATRAIRAGRGPNRDTPIIAFSANVMPEQTAEYLEAGVDGTLPKPFRLDDFYAQMAKWLGRSDRGEEMPKTGPDVGRKQSGRT